VRIEAIGALTVLGMASIAVRSFVIASARWYLSCGLLS
jgi:hypothetical protein